MATQAELDALRALALSGIRSITYQDRTVTYQSLEDMLDAIEKLGPTVAAEEGGSGRRNTFASFKRGTE